MVWCFWNLLYVEELLCRGFSINLQVGQVEQKTLKKLQSCKNPLNTHELLQTSCNFMGKQKQGKWHLVYPRGQVIWVRWSQNWVIWPRMIACLCHGSNDNPFWNWHITPEREFPFGALKAYVSEDELGGSFRGCITHSFMALEVCDFCRSPWFFGDTRILPWFLVENGCISHMCVSFYLGWFSTEPHDYGRIRVN